jgi:hypothetical protein
MGAYLGGAGEAGRAMEIEQIAKNSVRPVWRQFFRLRRFSLHGSINMQFVSELAAQFEGRKESHRVFFFRKTIRVTIPVRLERRADSNSYSTCAATTQL